MSLKFLWYNDFEYFVDATELKDNLIIFYAGNFLRRLHIISIYSDVLLEYNCEVKSNIG